MLFRGICLSDDTAFLSMNGDCRFPAVAVDGNTVYFTWLFAEARLRSLYFQRSTDEGKTWNGVRRISRENADCMPPSIAVDSGILHLLWIDCGEVIDGEIFYTRSFDGGDTWEKERKLLSDANSAQYPLILCSENSVYLLWQDVETRVFIKASHDRGQTWDDEILLGEVGKHSCYCFPPALTVDGNDLVVVWSDFREEKKRRFSSKRKSSDRWVSSVVCRKSNDGGRTWSRGTILTSNKISKEMTGEINNPTMFKNGSESFLFWIDKHRVPLGEVLYTGFDPSREKGPIKGTTLYPDPKRSPRCPSVVFDNNNNLHLAWTNFFGNTSIVHYGAINPEGTVLKDKIDLTSNDERYENPVIIRSASGLLHICWFSKPVDRKKPAKIFFRTSSDNGLTWETRRSQPENAQQ